MNPDVAGPGKQDLKLQDTGLSAMRIEAPARSLHHHIPDTPKGQAACILSQDPELLKEAQRLALALQELPQRYDNCPPRLLAVGGFVRDALLGLEPKDLDVEVYGVHPEDLEALLTKLYPERVNTTGRSFCVYKIALGNGRDIDVSIPRTENSTGPGTKDFEVVGKPDISIEEAARRRDFTMNALAADVLDGTVYDSFNGIEHLKAGTLAVTDPITFQEDPLRVYRGVQFCARMNLIPDVEARCLMKVMIERGDLCHLPSERVTEEFAKLLLKAKAPSIGFELMKDLGILSKHFPELDALTRCEQDPEWHPEGSVWTHTLKAVDVAASIVSSNKEFSRADALTVMYGTLCHDLGKPITTVFKDGHIRSPGHDNLGVEPARHFLERLCLPDELRSCVYNIVALHMKPGILSREHEQGKSDARAYVNKIRLLLKELSPGNLVRKHDDYLKRASIFLSVCESDHRGRDIDTHGVDPYPTGTEILEMIEHHQLDNQPLLLGRDLRALGLLPGKEFGNILDEVELSRDRGRIYSREEALDLVRRKHLIKGVDVLKRGVEQGKEVGTIIEDVRSRIVDGSLPTRNDVLEYLDTLLLSTKKYN